MVGTSTSALPFVSTSVTHHAGRCCPKSPCACASQVVGRCTVCPCLPACLPAYLPTESSSIESGLSRAHVARSAEGGTAPPWAGCSRRLKSQNLHQSLRAPSSSKRRGPRCSSCSSPAKSGCSSTCWAALSLPAAPRASWRPGPPQNPPPQQQQNPQLCRRRRVAAPAPASAPATAAAG